MSVKEAGLRVLSKISCILWNRKVHCRVKATCHPSMSWVIAVQPTLSRQDTDGVVSIVSRLWGGRLMNRDSILGKENYFLPLSLYLRTSRQALQPARTHIQWIRGTFSPTIGRPEREAHKVPTLWIHRTFASNPPFEFMALVFCNFSTIVIFTLSWSVSFTLFTEYLNIFLGIRFCDVFMSRHYRS